MKKLALPPPHLLINLIFVFFTITFSHCIYCQDLEKVNVNIGFCGSKSSGTPNLYLKENESINSKASNEKVSFQPCIAITVNLRFHIIRNSSSTGGQPVSVIPTILAKLNSQFNSSGIFFNNLGNDFIDNNTYFTGWGTSPNDVRFPPLIQINRVTNAVNIYLLPDDQWNQGLVQDIPSIAFVIGGRIQNVPLVTSNVIAHELGHCLGLFHTFRGCEQGGCLELPNGSNSSTCGDFVTDTPADPGIRFGSTSNSADFNVCAWKNTASLVLAVSCIAPGLTVSSYTPLTNNTMSYAPIFNCPSSFTSGQGNRMRMELLNPSSVLVGVRTTTTVSVNINTAYINSVFVPTSFPLTTNSLSTLTILDNEPWIPKTYTYSKTNLSGNMNTTLTPSGNSCGLYVTGTNGSNSINISVSQCGNPSRSMVFFIPSSLKYGPNPVVSELNLELTNTLIKEALPQMITIIDEKNAKIWYESMPQLLFDQGFFKEQNLIKVNTEKWIPGTYYMKAYKDLSKSDAQNETIRLQIK